MNLRICDTSSDKADCGCSRDRCGSQVARPGMTRRSFLRRGLAAAGGTAAVVAALSPLRELDTDAMMSVDQFLQKHYKEMSPEEMERALERIRRQVEKRYEVRPDIRDIKPMDGVEFAALYTFVLQDVNYEWRKSSRPTTRT